MIARAYTSPCVECKGSVIARVPHFDNVFTLAHVFYYTCATVHDLIQWRRCTTGATVRVADIVRV